MAYLDRRNRAPQTNYLPDGRLRVTYVSDVLDFIAKTPAQLLAEVWEAWGTADTKFTSCRLVKQDVGGQLDTPIDNPGASPPQLTQVYEELSATAETQVGNPAVSYDQDGNLNVSIEYIQFSANTGTYGTVGSTPAPSPFNAAILKDEQRTNDGTLHRIRRDYISNGTLSDVQNLRFGGKVIVRTITTIGTVVPTTPSGWTLVGPGTQHPDGRKIFVYEYASASGTPAGTGGVISEDTDYLMSPDQGTTGVTRKTIRQVSASTQLTNPIASPGVGYDLITSTYSDDAGFRMWTSIYALGVGLVSDDVDIRYKNSTDATGKLYIYTRTSLNVAPTAPSATISGTVVLISDKVRNGSDPTNGSIVYERQWAEGNGIISDESQGQADGSVIYTRVELDAAAMTPAYPGSGTGYLVKLDQRAADGYFVNTATYHKPPATVTFKKRIGFTKPGNASISGSPLQLVLSDSVTMSILADHEVSYATTQITDVPFTVSSYCTYYENYTPVDTGVAVARTKSLGGYLSGASGTSGTGVFNGIDCTAWAYSLGSSVPSSFTAALKVLDTDNDPYLTATDGTVVYRRTKVSYDFS